MAQDLFALAQAKRTDKIGLLMVIKHDIVPWLLSVGLVLLLSAAVLLLATSANSDVTTSDAQAILYSRARIFYLAMIVLAVLMARRSKGAWTWILAAILVIFFFPGPQSIASQLFPNSAFVAMIAMLGFLAAERMVEYIKWRYVMELSSPVLSIGATLSYILLLAVSAVMVMPR